jgi:hypothetical protein
MKLLGALLLIAACTKDQPSASAVAAAAQPPPPPPAAHTVAAPITGDNISGTVMETMSSGGYTYAKLGRGGSEVWVAGPETQLAVGAVVAKTSGSLMTAFHSDTLNRTFDQIYFVGSLGPGGPAPASTGGIPASPHGAPAAETPVEKIERATGGKTVAEIFAEKAALSGKPVVLRGKVVKVNNGILGHNWLHLRDGSGAAGANDLIVTTVAAVNLNDVVVVRGNVATNKDFGAGYSYAVLIEDATIAAN